MTLDLAWANEQQQWADRFARLLRDRLRWAIDHIREQAHQPDRLIEHVESFLHLIGQARDRAEIQPLATELIDALNPWPARWGYGERWIAQLQFAAEDAARRGQGARQAKLLAELAALLLIAGRTADAITMSEQAIKLAHDYRAPLSWSIATEAQLSALRQQGRTADAWQCLRAREGEWPSVIVGADQSVQVTAQAHVAFQHVELLKIKGEYDHALDLNRQIIADLEALPQADVTVLAEAYSTLGFVYYPQGRYPEALAAIQRALALRVQADDRTLEVSERGNLGLIYLNRGQFAAAEQVFRQMVADTDRLQMRASHMRAIGLLASVTYMRGDLPRALQYDERSIELAEGLNNEYELARSRGHRAAVLLRMGRYAEALPIYEVTTELQRQQGRRMMLFSTLGGLSYCYLKLGQPERATATMQHMQELAAELNRPLFQLAFLRYRAIYEPPRPAAVTLHEALNVARQLQRRFDEAACLLSLSGVVEDITERETLWQAGANILIDCGAETWLAGHSPEDPPALPVSI